MTIGAKYENVFLKVTEGEPYGAIAIAESILLRPEETGKGEVKFHIQRLPSETTESISRTVEIPQEIADGSEIKVGSELYRIRYFATETGPEERAILVSDTSGGKHLGSEIGITVNESGYCVIEIPDSEEITWTAPAKIKNVSDQIMYFRVEDGEAPELEPNYVNVSWNIVEP